MQMLAQNWTAVIKISRQLIKWQPHSW